PYALQAEKTALIARQANAAVALLRLEDPKPIDDFLTVDRDPEALSQFIFRIRGREISPLLIMQRVRELSTQGLAADTKPRQQQHLRLYGMVLGLGEFTVAQLPTYERVRFVDELIEMYRTHPSRAVHSALGWLLQRWGQNTAVRAIDETPLAYDPRGDREWYVVKVEPGFEGNPRKQSTPISDPNFIDLAAPIYFTMLVFPGGEFEMRSGLRKATTVSVPGPLAVSDREVTWRQFSPHDLDQHRHFCDSTPGLISKELRGRRLSPNDPVVFLSFDQAIYYCRWLTAAFMPGEENQCYGQEPVGGKVDDPAQWEWLMDSRRRGFRMLTKSEWEYVATAGMETQYSFGTSESLLGEYAWYRMNSGGGPHRTGELRPSIGGLFDVHGNVAEWTSEKSASHTVCGSGWDLDATWSGFSAKRIVNGGVGPTCGFRIAVVPVADGDQ
ncbi:MAG: formylglycine-generating enzyme family protein, partial [Pirellula sp.]